MSLDMVIDLIELVKKPGRSGDGERHGGECDGRRRKKVKYLLYFTFRPVWPFK